MAPGGATDEELMARAARDDRAAFDALVLRHRDRALAVAARYLPSAEEAEDVAQEAFLRLYRARRSYRPSARFTTFLYRVVANVCIEEGRKRRRRPRTGPLPDEPRVASRDGPEREVLDGETARRVQAALERLPANQRLAVILCRYEGRSYREIAEVLECSEKAVEAMLYRARQALWRELADLHDPQGSDPQ